MGEIFTIEYLLEVIFMAISFFTFIKLISKDVYLSNHRMLPTIAAVITIHNFYICISPFMRGEGAIEMLSTLCDLCSMVIMYMMFFYLLFLKRPKYVHAIVAIVTSIMILLCIYDFFLYGFNRSRQFNVDLVSVLIIFLMSFFIGVFTKSRRFFDRQEKNISRFMVVAFVIALAGYVLQAYVCTRPIIRPLAFAIDCVIFYWMASTNRIEDTASILKGNLYDTIETPICFVNSEFYVIDFNNAAGKLFPYGNNIEFCFEHGDYKNKFILAENMVKNNTNDKEYLVAERWYTVHWTKISNDNGVKGYIFMAIDITNQHANLNKAKRETLEKSQFLAHMSHELRSPLHAIIGVGDILIGKRELTYSSKELVAHIKKSSNDLLELVDSILDYSKLESGKFIFVEREYDVVECLEDMAYGKIINIQSKPIDFSIEAKTDIPKYLIGDELRVREIFHNIIGNSIKFTDKGSIKVELSFERQDDMVKVDFSVADTGVGMTPAQIDEIFKEYTSLANENSIKGTGLGLAITKELIARMGGHIYAESDGVSGTRFYGDFYQKCNTFENSPRQIFNRRTIAIQKRGLNPTYFTPECIYPAAKFLIADDMKINLEIMKQLISPWKCSVTTVSDGLSAIEACQKNKFDLIFLDQLMAPMNGLETCYELKNITDAPIILVTADEIDNIQAVMERYGFSDYLTKPVHGYHIKRIIDKFMPANLAKNATQEEILRGDYEHTRMYKNTLETFVKEMQPIILNLPNYRVNDPEQFTVKVHGINGVCKQIDRKELAEQALIMEMAAESDTWAYVDEHMDDFLSLICDVVEEVTSELTQINASLEEH